MKTKRWVYFIQAANGSVKIGSSFDPTGRLRCLQTSHPGALTLLAARRQIESDYQLPTGILDSVIRLRRSDFEIEIVDKLSESELQ